MKIQNIVNNPQYIEVVSKWIYTEFFENIRHGISYDEIFLDFRLSSSSPPKFMSKWRDGKERVKINGHPV